ncbi:peptidoglycan-binding protein [Priestia megaterium]|uniref:peptidoglycan-binding domain-containing protein n=1 Tax=Priestia megaterium TaxID=1404 RepID=UPI002E21ACE5|nr:peptidoglycan-binding protein [Priestia megaterium]
MAELLRKGDKGRSVKTLQRQLIRENNNALVVGEVDGEYGSETENAVLTFQKKHSDLGNTGVADLPTQARLIKVILLKEGSKGRGVKMLQESLIRFTINIPSGADGIYGPDTTKAVKTFQTQNGILADGQAGVVTLDTLDKALNVYYVGSGASGTIYGSVVRMVQSFIIKSGIDLPRFGVDGEYGTETTNGVKVFQEKNNLRVDGVAGPRTLNRLDPNADYPMTFDELKTEFEKISGTIFEKAVELPSSEQQTYIKILENNKVFKKVMPGSNPLIEHGVVTLMLGEFAGGEGLIGVHGFVKEQSGTEFISYIDPNSDTLTSIFVFTNSGVLFGDKGVMDVYDISGNKIIQMDQIWMDYEDEALEQSINLANKIRKYNTTNASQVENFYQVLAIDRDMANEIACTLILEGGCLALGVGAGAATSNPYVGALSYDACSAAASIYTSTIQSCPKIV